MVRCLSPCGGAENRAKDILGRVYEYFLGQFATAEGKKGGEFYTPRAVVRLLVEMLKMRARSWTLRDGFADVLRGVHIREEVDDFIEIRGLWTSLRNAVQDTKRGAARPNRRPFSSQTPLARHSCRGRA